MLKVPTNRTPNIMLDYILNKKVELFLFRSTLVGEGTIYSNFFFVQSFFADLYINRRGFLVVSLENPSSVEY